MTGRSQEEIDRMAAEGNYDFVWDDDYMEYNEAAVLEMKKNLQNKKISVENQIVNLIEDYNNKQVFKQIENHMKHREELNNSSF